MRYIYLICQLKIITSHVQKDVEKRSDNISLLYIIYKIEYET